MLVVLFAVLLVLSLCGIVGAILWLVLHHGQRLTVHDLIPLVGFTLSGLVSLGLFTLSAAGRHPTPTTGQRPTPTASPAASPPARPSVSGTPTTVGRAS